jgi:hypothetical protein
MPTLTAVSAIANVVKLVTGWVSYIETKEDLDRRRFIEALVALHRAANLTRSYLADAAVTELSARLGEHGEYNAVPRALRHAHFPGDGRRAISEAWVGVGEKLGHCLGARQVDGFMAETLRDLMDRCFRKGEYWAAPAEWKQSGVDIGLTRLMDDATALLDQLQPDPRARENRPRGRRVDA